MMTTSGADAGVGIQGTFLPWIIVCFSKYKYSCLFQELGEDSADEEQPTGMWPHQTLQSQAVHSLNTASMYCSNTQLTA